ncbi:PA3496 family putative envelope integrity protein [Porticoccus sp.]
MSGEDALEEDDFDAEDGETAAEPNAEEVVKVVNSESRRRLEDRLEERRLQKMIRDYDFDVD